MLCAFSLAGETLERVGNGLNSHEEPPAEIHNAKQDADQDTEEETIQTSARVTARL